MKKLKGNIAMRKTTIITIVAGFMLLIIASASYIDSRKEVENGMYLLAVLTCIYAAIGAMAIGPKITKKEMVKQVRWLISTEKSTPGKRPQVIAEMIEELQRGILDGMNNSEALETIVRRVMFDETTLKVLWVFVIENEYSEVARMLIDKPGIDVNGTYWDGKNTALHILSQVRPFGQNALGMLDVLLEGKANLIQENEGGGTPFSFLPKVLQLTAKKMILKYKSTGVSDGEREEQDRQADTTTEEPPVE